MNSWIDRNLLSGLIQKSDVTQRLILLFVLLWFCVGCAAIQKQRSPEAIIKTHKLLNQESGVVGWQARMESEGFECEMVKNETFSTTYKCKHRIDNADFLRCRRESESGIDDVALVVENDQVIDTIIDFVPNQN